MKLKYFLRVVFTLLLLFTRLRLLFQHTRMQRTDFFRHCPHRGLLTPLLDDDTKRDCDYRSWDVYEVEHMVAPNSKRLVIWHHKRVSAVVYHQFKALEGLGPGVTQGIFARTDFETKDVYLILAYKGTMKQRDREPFFQICKEVGREAVVGEPLEFRFADADKTMAELWARAKEAGIMGVNNRVEEYDRGLTFDELQDYLKRRPMTKNVKMASPGKYQALKADIGSPLNSKRFYSVLECDVKEDESGTNPWGEIILYNAHVTNVIFYNFPGLKASSADTHVVQGTRSTAEFMTQGSNGTITVVRRWGYIKEWCVEWFHETCEEVGKHVKVGDMDQLMRDLWDRVDEERILRNIH
ncbi:hypothetical protein L249_1260 [Ophiocordyceps polyrhachis-furcata BCC 54312]|uniref:Uncharacterized protein n=1 Tax=Ophiocordyceps polyrhachis-furcata BCC 54312 TaxID=1330021 RepID=A0A367LCC1_9HYPO|nr:hypothetical protein L249_1260 [Ophiocordyceps polyrhachis-furcata BCC 54312]